MITTKALLITLSADELQEAVKDYIFKENVVIKNEYQIDVDKINSPMSFYAWRHKTGD